MVRPRLVISAVRLCCCCRRRNRPTRATASTTSAVMSRLSLTLSGTRIVVAPGGAFAGSAGVIAPGEGEPLGVTGSEPVQGKDPFVDLAHLSPRVLFRPAAGV